MTFWFSAAASNSAERPDGFAGTNDIAEECSAGRSGMLSDRLEVPQYLATNSLFGPRA